MTDKDFIPWLQGFLTGKLELNMKDMGLLKDAVDTVIPTHIAVPNTAPIPNPMNPTCTTGKQLLTDEWKPDPKKTGPPKLPY